MAFLKMITCVALVCLIGTAAAGPQRSGASNADMDSIVNEMRSNCESGADSLACMKFKVTAFLDSILKQDSYKMFENVEVRENGFVAKESGARSAEEETIVDSIEKYVESHDVSFNVPAAGAQITVSPKNINDDELSLKIKFAPEGRSVGEGKYF